MTARRTAPPAAQTAGPGAVDAGASDPVGTNVPAGDTAALARWLTEQRWFATPDPAAGGESGSGVIAMAAVELETAPAIATVVIDTASGDRYQLSLPAAAAIETPPTALAAASGRRAPGRAGRPMADLGSDPDALDALGRFVAEGGTAANPALGTVSGHWLPGATPLGTGPARLLGAEQSNTSAVVGGSHVLKLFRRLQAGPHPELEVGRHLAAAAPGTPVARLSGWYELAPARGEVTVLGVVQELVPGALDGWSLVLGALAGDPGGLLHRLHHLGSALAALHDALALPATGGATAADADPEAPESFGATPLGADQVRQIVEGVAGEASRLLATSIDRPAGLAPVVGRADQVADLARSLAAAVGDDLGAAIRHHGDLHLGQTVVGPDGWVILDFEGEPNRPLAERRRRHSPLRDVAGMLRSIAYAAATHRRAAGVRLSPGWEPAARAAFLDGYLAAVEPSLVPASAVAIRRLLTLFELEKVVYEIGYEVAHRPDWVVLPVGGLRALLDQHAPGSAS
ncbi:MAG: hypothetical protein JWM89_4033 [Acidimicrobiales bacterium]|nr:hypothetical protein [Acidimicrobiales bacterium]